MATHYPIETLGLAVGYISYPFAVSIAIAAFVSVVFAVFVLLALVVG